MKVEVAKTAGFCFGVDIAVNKVYELLEKGEKVATLGPIIHNNTVVDDLKSRGVLVVNTPRECPKDYKLVIRSHGVTANVYDDIYNNELNYDDGTCPFVRKIHNIVENEMESRKIFIAGDKNHPEIIGINGHCDNTAFIFSEIDELKEKMEELNNADLPIALVAQTTFNIEKWNIFLEFIKKHYTNVKIFGTICSATTKRQTEAIKMAKDMDVMVVVGGLHSSNSKKLKDVCEQYTKSYLIETADSLDDIDFGNAQKIGITAGASTPDAIIEEVLNKMSNSLNNTENEDFCFEQALEESLSPVYRNQRLMGVVTSVSNNEAQVDIGKKYTGIIHISELTNDSGLNATDILKKDDEIEVVVLKVNDMEGTVELSKKRVDAIAGFVKLEEAFDNNEILNVKVTGVVKGGVLAAYNGINVFIPASQLSLKRVEDISIFKGEELEIKLIDVDRSKRRAVGSAKTLLFAKQKEIEEKIWQTISIGQKREGTVKSITNYGAFIDIGGVDGLVHISELSWSKITHPKQIVSIGDKLNVYIKDLDVENRKISLGHKDENDNPWIVAEEKFHVGDAVDVKIMSITSFGAFAQLMEGVEGLIHISQIDNKRIEKVSNALSIGQEVKAKLLEFDINTKRVSLSIRALIEDNESEEQEKIVEEYNSNNNAD